MFPAEKDSSYVPACCVYQDELKQMMNMIGMSGSCLPYLLNDLYYNDHVMNATRQKAVEVAVGLSLLGCLKCADPDEFHSIWSAGTASGLYDRFIFVPGASNWVFDQEWAPTHLELDDRYRDDPESFCMGPEPLKQTVMVKAAALRSISAWDAENIKKGIRSRCPEIAKRVEIISAAVNGDHEITPECAAAALAFGEWQLRVRGINTVSEAETLEGTVTSAILKAFEDEEKKTLGAYYSWRYLKINHHNWIKRWGSPSVDRVFRTLQDELDLEPWLPDKDGKVEKPKTLRYRIGFGDEEGA